MRRAATAAALLVLAAAAPAYRPGPHNVDLPPDWESRFLRFAMVDNPDRRIVRHLHVNPEALAAARPGQPLPYGTTLIMAEARARLDAAGVPLRDAAGRFLPEPGWTAILVQRKEPGWGEGYGPEKRNGAWEYARFTGTGARHPGGVEACFACHLALRAGQDFTFHFWDLVQARGR